MYPKKSQYEEVRWQLQHMYREGCLKSQLYLHSFARASLVLCTPSAVHVLQPDPGKEQQTGGDSSARHPVRVHKLKKG